MKNKDRQIVFRLKKEYAKLSDEIGTYRAKIRVAKKVRKLMKRRASNV